MPLLCNGEDSFLASGRNLNLTAPHGDGPVTNITLEFDCAIIVCGAGQRIARLSSGSPVCITCPSGTYNADVNSTCKPCPPGGACTGGSSLAAQAGYFYFEQSFYKCKDQRCCVTVRGLLAVPFICYADPDRVPYHYDTGYLALFWKIPRLW